MNEGTGEKYVCNTVQSTVNAAASLSAPAAERNSRAGNADWFAQGSIVWCRDESQPMVQTPLLTHDASPKNVEDMPLISDAEIPGPKDEADLNAMAEDGSGGSREADEARAAEEANVERLKAKAARLKAELEAKAAAKAELWARVCRSTGADRATIERWMHENRDRGMQVFDFGSGARVVEKLAHLPADQIGAHLCVRIVSGTDLMAADCTGFSDPYVDVCVWMPSEPTCKHMWRSQTKSQTLDPEWDESKRVGLLSTTGCLVHLVCHDWDRVGTDDFLGESLLDLATYADGALHTLKVDLEQYDTRSAGVQVRGFLTVELQVTDACAEHADQLELEAEAQGREETAAADAAAVAKEAVVVAAAAQEAAAAVEEEEEEAIVVVEEAVMVAAEAAVMTADDQAVAEEEAALMRATAEALEAARCHAPHLWPSSEVRGAAEAEAVVRAAAESEAVRLETEAEAAKAEAEATRRQAEAAAKAQAAKIEAAKAEAAKAEAAKVKAQAARQQAEAEERAANAAETARLKANAETKKAAEATVAVEREAARTWAEDEMRAAAHTQASRLKVAEDATAAADVAAAQLKAEAIAMAVVEAKAKAARLKAEVQAKAAAAEAELEAEAVERQRQVSRPGVAPAERPGCNKRPTTVQQRSRRPGEARRAVIPSMPPSAAPAASSSSVPSSAPSHLVFSVPINRVNRAILSSLHSAARQRSEALHNRLREAMELNAAAYAGGIRFHGSLLRDDDATRAEMGAVKLALRRSAAVEGALSSLLQLLRRAPENAFRMALSTHAELLTDSNVNSLALRCGRAKDARTIVRNGCDVLARAWRGGYAPGEGGGYEGRAHASICSERVADSSHHAGLVHLRSPPCKKPPSLLASAIAQQKRESLYLTSSMPIFAAAPAAPPDCLLVPMDAPEREAATPWPTTPSAKRGGSPAGATARASTGAAPSPPFRQPPWCNSPPRFQSATGRSEATAVPPVCSPGTGSLASTPAPPKATATPGAVSLSRTTRRQPSSDGAGRVASSTAATAVAIVQPETLMEPQVAVDEQVDPAVLASSYWRRTQMQRGFDTFSSTTAYHSPPLPPPSPPPQASMQQRTLAAQAGRGRELPSADRIVQHAGWAGKRRALRSWARAAIEWETAAAQVASADAVCAFGLLAHGWHSWRARAARWSAELNRQLGADYHVQQRAVSGAFFSWMVRATMILERSAREAVLVSLLRSGFLLKAWRRFAGAIEEEVRIRADLCLQRLAVADAFRRWTTQMVPCASAKRDVAALAVSSMADPFDDAPTAADVVSALADTSAVPMPSAAGTVEIVPSPDRPDGNGEASSPSSRKASDSPSAAKSTGITEEDSVMERLAKIKTAVAPRAVAPMTEAELLAELKEARFAAQMGDTDLEREGARARVRLLLQRLSRSS